MEPLEVGLLVIGVICIVVSIIFVPQESGKKEAEIVLSKEQMESVTKQVDELLEEQLTTLEEKTEISMDKISNRKIMELTEYSDTVLAQINKNHEETMFLYDMLNEKTKEVKKVVSDYQKEVADKTVKETAEAEVATKTATKTTRTRKKTTTQADKPEGEEVTKATEEVAATAQEEPKKPKRTRTTKKAAPNNNEKILQLYNEGKTNMEIAKTLGLGLGEVKLVIDLFKGE